jgi:hypothetical protein
VWRAVREPHDVDEVLVQAAKCTHPASSDKIIKAKVNAKAASHEVIVSAIY